MNMKYLVSNFLSQMPTIWSVVQEIWQSEFGIPIAVSYFKLYSNIKNGLEGLRKTIVEV